MGDSADPSSINTTAPAAGYLKSTNHQSFSHSSLPSPPLSPQQDRPLSQHHHYSLAHSPFSVASSDDEDFEQPNHSSSSLGAGDSNYDSNNPRSSSGEQLTTLPHTVVGPQDYDFGGHAPKEAIPVSQIPVDGQQQLQQQLLPQQEAYQQINSTFTMAAGSHLLSTESNMNTTDTKLAASTLAKLHIHTDGHHRNNAPTSFAPGIHPLHDHEDDSHSQAGISPSTPMRPSQLRKHHESLRLKAREEQAEKKRADAKKKRASKVNQLPSATSCDVSTPSDKKDDIEEIPIVRPQIFIPYDDDDNYDKNLMSPTSYHASGALIRAKSYSMFESSPSQHQQPYHHAMVYGNGKADIISQGQMPSLFPSSGTTSPFLSKQPPLPPSMDTRDWVKMQARINSLEQQVAHVSRTNQLLNQELDKVNGHLDRLTREEGEGWRREYEFLVRQVDLMHRQLSNQYHIFCGGEHAIPSALPAGLEKDDGTNMTRMLQREVRDLSESLRKWQAAYKEADEQYRRKLDGERLLKQTLQEREEQLTSLMEKLSGYEREFHRSMSNYEELKRLSHELQVLEDKHPEHVIRALESATMRYSASSTSLSSLTSHNSRPPSSSPDTAMSETGSTVSVTSDHEWSSRHAGVRKRFSTASHDSISTPEASHCIVEDPNVETGDHMPGTFPVPRRNSIAPPQPPPIDHLSVSILSWAALLATYMVS
ncbi:hypothetical protein BGW42_002047 [Actinomortierella wolfii]|nr:hypothetical protein BGW42_002047 [Actinomortierella wolfii]